MATRMAVRRAKGAQERLYICGPVRWRRRRGIRNSWRATRRIVNCVCASFVECMFVVVVVEIIKLYLVQMGRFLAPTGYVASSPNHVQNNVQNEIRMYLNETSHQGKRKHTPKHHSQPLGSELLSPQDIARATRCPQRTTNKQIQKVSQRKEGKKKSNI